MQHVLSHGDRGAMEHRVHVDRAVVAHVFAERSFRLNIAALVEVAFERHLGVGGHPDVVDKALDHRRALAAEGGDQRQFVPRLAGGRRKKIERMRAHRESDREALAAVNAGLVDALEV